MRRYVALVTVLMMLVSGANAQGMQYAVFLNGEELSFHSDAGQPLSLVLTEGRLYVPAEALGKALYTDVTTDPHQCAVWVDGEKLIFTAGGEVVSAVTVDGVVYVPLLMFANAVGIELALDSTSYRLTSAEILDYQTGEKALLAGEYEQACEAFARAGDFSDASVRIQEVHYRQAEALLANGDYAAAAEAYGRAGSYQDAVARVDEAWYLLGKQLFTQGKLEEASAAYQKAGSYMDAASLVVSVFADDGARKLNAGDLKAAYHAFARVGDTEAGRQSILQVLYGMAGQQYDAGRTELAITLYQLLGDYQDAGTQLAAIYYKQGSTNEAAGKILPAIEAYKQAGDYQDAQEKWKQLTYDQARKHQANQKYDDAYALFDTIRGYSDVDNRLSVNSNLKQAAQRAESVKLAQSINVGDTFQFGSYVHVGSSSSKKQTIEWQVLEKDGAKLLLLSRYALEKRAYHSSNTKSINWSNCSLRTWLNGAFLQNAFTQAERNAIVSTSVTSKTSSGSTTTTKDKIFLPTYYELVSHLEKADRKTRTKTTTPVIIWSRDRYTGKSNASYAYAQTINTSADSSYQSVTSQLYIRPAMWVNLEADYDWTTCLEKTTTTVPAYSAIRNLMARGDYQQALQKLTKEATSATVTELMQACRYHLGCEAILTGALEDAVQYLKLADSAGDASVEDLLAVIELLK